LTGEPGASLTYTDLAIETIASVQAIYGLADRQTQGFLQSIFEVMKLNFTCTRSASSATYIKAILLVGGRNEQGEQRPKHIFL
jgi:Transposase DDE domain